MFSFAQARQISSSVHSDRMHRLGRSNNSQTSYNKEKITDYSRLRFRFLQFAVKICKNIVTFVYNFRKFRAQIKEA